MEQKIVTRVYCSPCGELLVGAYDGKICLCDWMEEKRREEIDLRLQRKFKAEFEQGSTRVLDDACRQLDQYFYYERSTFDVPLLIEGTDFQKRVWRHLTEIPYGSTISYAELAKQVGMPKAVRAVANANRSNVLSIFIPCHRVIGSNGSLTGYGGGLFAKSFLLNHERHWEQDSNHN